jgi:hypothetical protein
MKIMRRASAMRAVAGQNLGTRVCGGWRVRPGRPVNRLKQSRAVAARYDKCAYVFHSRDQPRFDPALLPPKPLPHGTVDAGFLASGGAGQGCQLGKVASGLAFLPEPPINPPQVRPLTSSIFKSQ